MYIWNTHTKYSSVISWQFLFVDVKIVSFVGICFPFAVLVRVK